MTFQKELKKYQEIINSELDSYLNKEISQINELFTKNCYELIREYAKNGKRIRPTALILSYLACDGKSEKKILPIAISVELLHTYSLILDDIMDEDDLRRNNPTVYKKLKDYYLTHFSEKNYQGPLFNKTSSRFAVSFAVMIGNLTNILSKKSILSSEFNHELKTKAITLIENTDQQIYHGQILDLSFEYQNKVNKKQYLEMIKLKTCVLFGLCFELGALFAKADENLRHTLKEFGINSAYSFQIQDDIIDISDKGYAIGSDIKNGKKTLLMIKTMELANDEQKNIIRKVFGSQNITELKKIIEIMHSSGAVKYCQKLALDKNNQAKDLLKKIKINPHYKELFIEFTDFLFSHKF